MYRTLKWVIYSLSIGNLNKSIIVFEDSQLQFKYLQSKKFW